MNKILCKKEKHFYDADIYAACPHCKKEAEEEGGAAKFPPEKEGGIAKFPPEGKPSGFRGLFDSFNKNRSKDMDSHEGKGRSSGTAQKTDRAESHTRGFTDPEDSHTTSLQKQEDPPSHEETPQPEPQQPPSAIQPEESLTSMIETIQGKEPKTVGFWGNQNTEPVVGWLVCVKGPEQGEYYPLRAGKNTVGREISMDVVIRDNSVSRRHTVIKYDPRSRKAKILPSEGDGLVYRENEDFDVPTELHDRDVLTMGKSQLMLVMLCGPEFTWEEWMEGDGNGNK